MAPNSELTQSAQAYWDNAAKTYDRDFAVTLIGQTRRTAVWSQLDRIFCAGQRVLELNCGTGIDAVHLAERGIRILACDIAPRMIELASERAKTAGFCDLLDFRVLPTEDISALEGEAPFDGAFSNFSGLNCVEDLSGVARSLARRLKPGAPVLLCMVGRFVPWEILWFLSHGDRQNALRRFRPKRLCCYGALQVQHLSVQAIARLLAPEFRLRKWKGIGIAVPPSYMEHWARRFPAITNTLARVDRLIGSLPVCRSMADCVLLEFQRRSAVCNR